MSDFEANALGAGLPRVAAGELAVRVVYPLADEAFFLDVYKDRATGTTAMHLSSVNRLTGVASPLGRGAARLDGGRILAEAQTTDGRTASSGFAAEDPLDCGGCQALGGVGGLLLGLVCAGTGILCAINAMIFAIGVSTVCEVEACPYPGLRAGFAPNEIACSFASCDIAATVYNPPNATTSSVSSGIVWRYPTGSWGTTKSGFPTSSVQDASDATLPINGPGNYYRVGWSHVGSDPYFQQCTTEISISITVVWSNFDFASTGWMPGSKLFLQGCPGQHYVVE